MGRLKDVFEMHSCWLAGFDSEKGSAFEVARNKFKWLALPK